MKRVIPAMVVLAACGRGDTATELLRGTGPFVAQIEVPRAAAEASQGHIDRLRGALLGRDPAGTAGIWGRERSHGDSRGSAFVWLLEHAPAYGDGTSLTDVAREIETELESEAKRRGVATSFEATRGERHIDVAYSIGAGALLTRVRARIFAADRMYEVGCMCSAAMCSAMATCTLPDPPPGALPVEQVMHLGR